MCDENEQEGWTILPVDGTDYPALIRELNKRWTEEQWENFIRNTAHLPAAECPPLGKVLYVECRSTGHGAHTTAGGAVVSSSKTGNHWTEKVILAPGDRVPVTDISNSGKHRCYWLSLDDDGKVVRDYNQDIECSVCDFLAERMGICRPDIVGR